MIIAVSTIIGLWINFANVDPIKALIYAAVINGIIAVPLVVAIMKISNDKKILEHRTNGKIPNIVGWIAVINGVLGCSYVSNLDEMIFLIHVGMLEIIGGTMSVTKGTTFFGSKSKHLK